MTKLMKRLAALMLAALLLFAGCAALAEIVVDAALHPVTEDGRYDALEEVAVYLATYKKLPGNFLTKKQAQDRGWQSAGTLDQVAPGYSIGGNRFGNYEGAAPDAPGRQWIECDIDYRRGSRNAKRIIYSNDDLIYYTQDHYNTFEQVVVVFGSAFAPVPVAYGESYTARDEVASYLIEYGELPINYIGKNDAQELGYSQKKDNMGQVAPEFAIGGDKFGNKEGLLPKKNGRVWRECDVDMKADGKRGSSRILYSSDGLIYFTSDKFKSFTKLWGEE